MSWISQNKYVAYEQNNYVYVVCMCEMWSIVVSKMHSNEAIFLINR